MNRRELLERLLFLRDDETRYSRRHLQLTITKLIEDIEMDGVLDVQAPSDIVDKMQLPTADQLTLGIETYWREIGFDSRRASNPDANKAALLKAVQVMALPSIALTPSELQSGLDRVRWAELLIRQLPENHDGRNSWLLNYGSKE